MFFAGVMGSVGRGVCLFGGLHHCSSEVSPVLFIPLAAAAAVATAAAVAVLYLEQFCFHGVIKKCRSQGPENFVCIDCARLVLWGPLCLQLAFGLWLWLVLKAQVGSPGGDVVVSVRWEFHV